jgi:AcrR family transcriptional regulator
MPSLSANQKVPGTRARRGAYAKSADTREKILAAAREVAGEAGFHGVSVAKIAERAGVAIGNLHYHFGSLDDLLRELMERITEQITNEALQAMENTGDVFEREEAVFRAYLAFVHRNPTYVRLAEEVRVHHPDIYQRTLSLWVELLRASLQEGIDSGVLRPMSPEEIGALGHYLIGARYFLDQMIEGVHGQEYPGDEVVVATYMNLLRAGLTAPAAAG